jgi:transposase
MANDKKVVRRQYSAEFKAQVMAECEAPGVSVAKVARAHGINDNIVHGWRKLAREAGVAALPRPSQFVPVTIPAAPTPAHLHSTDAPGIEVELKRGAVTMKITWPLTAAADFAGWMRELLR